MWQQWRRGSRIAKVKFSASGCTYHRVIHMQFCLYLQLECKHVKKKISKELLCLMDYKMFNYIYSISMCRWGKSFDLFY